MMRNYPTKPPPLWLAIILKLASIAVNAAVMIHTEWQLRHLLHSPQFRALLAETPPDPPTPLLEAIDKQRRDEWAETELRKIVEQMSDRSADA